MSASREFGLVEFERHIAASFRRMVELQQSLSAASSCGFAKRVPSFGGPAHVICTGVCPWEANIRTLRLSHLSGRFQNKNIWLSRGCSSKFSIALATS
jgi:hypothetical protein